MEHSSAKRLLVSQLMIAFAVEGTEHAPDTVCGNPASRFEANGVSAGLLWPETLVCGASGEITHGCGVAVSYVGHSNGGSRRSVSTSGDNCGVRPWSREGVRWAKEVADWKGRRLHHEQIVSVSNLSLSDCTPHLMLNFCLAQSGYVFVLVFASMEGTRDDIFHVPNQQPNHGCYDE